MKEKFIFLIFYLILINDLKCYNKKLFHFYYHIKRISTRNPLPEMPVFSHWYQRKSGEYFLVENLTHPAGLASKNPFRAHAQSQKNQFAVRHQLPYHC